MILPMSVFSYLPTHLISDATHRRKEKVFLGNPLYSRNSKINTEIVNICIKLFRFYYSTTCSDE